MIEALGSSPINSIVTTGINEFMSIFRGRPSNAFGNDTYSSRYPRAYTTARGILISKEVVESSPNPDLRKGYYFQFNPQTISDVKSVLYETREYAGLSYVDYAWAGGSTRTISFQLFLDNTPQSKQRHFRPTAYGSKLAKEIKTQGNGYTYDSNSGKYELDKLSFKNAVKGAVKNDSNNVVNFAKDAASTSIWQPTKGPSSFEYIENDAYSISRVDERGILPEVELIQSFLYPASLDNESTPRFAEGGVISAEQFRPPSAVILALGPLYLEGVIKSAPVTYTLFDEDLTPIRGTIDIEFSVFEFENLERKIAR